MPKFEIDIWFDQKPEKLHLGSVIVEAETEDDAHKIAWRKTEHWIIGKVKD
jgi:hypothetical protein